MPGFAVIDGKLRYTTTRARIPQKDTFSGVYDAKERRDLAFWQGMRRLLTVSAMPRRSNRVKVDGRDVY